jgi:hypothetical protein
MCVGIPVVELKHHLLVGVHELVVFVAAVRRVKAKNLLIPTRRCGDIGDGDERLRFHTLKPVTNHAGGFPREISRRVVHAAAADLACGADTRAVVQVWSEHRAAAC